MGDISYDHKLQMGKKEKKMTHLFSPDWLVFGESAQRFLILDGSVTVRSETCLLLHADSHLHHVRQ